MRDWLPALLLHDKRYSDALNFIQIWTTKKARRGPDHEPCRGGIDFKTPNKNPLSEIDVNDLSPSSYWLEMMYNGALAVFKLWGDCTLARQYLNIGCDKNKWVLIKILSRVKTPCEYSLNVAPRCRLT